MRQGPHETPESGGVQRRQNPAEGDLARYAQTITWQFATVSQAEAFAQYRITDAWIECDRAGNSASTAQTPKQTVKSTKHVHLLRLANGAIPPLDERVVHLLGIRKRPAGVVDDVAMAEMKIGREVSGHGLTGRRSSSAVGGI